MHVRLWRQELSLASPVRASAQVHTSRPHLFLEVEIDGVRGLGEISPQPTSLHGDPGVDDVIVELEHFTVRQFVEAALREGRTPEWSRVTHFAGSRRASYPASALLEMALLDAHLRAERASVEQQWPEHVDTPVQSTVSLLDDNVWDVRDDAAQVRAKVGAALIDEAQWLRLSTLGLPVLLDFNCAAHDLGDVVALTTRAQSYVDVVAVEQPFAPGNVVEHARLAGVLDVAVSLDEGVRHRRDLDQIARYGAASIVCVKPARVGGYAQARTMIERARTLGLGVYLGGFFESPLARRANRALARHCVSLPSDIGEVELVATDVLAPDPWGCGYLPGPDLESMQTLVNRQW